VIIILPISVPTHAGSLETLHKTKTTLKHDLDGPNKWRIWMNYSNSPGWKVRTTWNYNQYDLNVFHTRTESGTLSKGKTVTSLCRILTPELACLHQMAHEKKMFFSHLETQWQGFTGWSIWIYVCNYVFMHVYIYIQIFIHNIYIITYMKIL
jgi:hypothetical protein